mgnify:CR=1 FL=1
MNKSFKWTIDKQFDFCFGHRVWSQDLNTKYSLDGCLACRHLHGHQGKVKLFLGANNLKHGMVTDFKHTNIFKKWLDDTLDHKFIIDMNMSKGQFYHYFTTKEQLVYQVISKKTIELINSTVEEYKKEENFINKLNLIFAIYISEEKYY